MAKNELLSIVSIAGFDPSQGAGLAADKRASNACGVNLIEITTCDTNQTLSRALSWQENENFLDSLNALEQQINVIAGIKIGMIGTQNNLLILLDFLKRLEKNIPIVLDPVLQSSSGMKLWEGLPEDLLSLAPYVTLITPNLIELSALAGGEISEDPLYAIKQANYLIKKGFFGVLIKGGHANDPKKVLDILVTKSCLKEFVFQRVKGQYRGTGCWLSTAITSELAKGNTIQKGVEKARKCFQKAIERAVKENLRWVP